MDAIDVDANRFAAILCGADTLRSAHDSSDGNFSTSVKISGYTRAAGLLPFRQGGRFHFSGLMECQQPQPLLQPHPQSEALETPLLQPQPVSQSRRMMIRKMHQLFEQPIVLPPLQLLRKSAAVLTRAPLSSTYYEAPLFAVTLSEPKHNFLFSGVN